MAHTMGQQISDTSGPDVPDGPEWLIWQLAQMMIGTNRVLLSRSHLQGSYLSSPMDRLWCNSTQYIHNTSKHNSINTNTNTKKLTQTQTNLSSPAVVQLNRTQYILWNAIHCNGFVICNPRLVWTSADAQLNAVSDTTKCKTQFNKHKHKQINKHQPTQKQQNQTRSNCEECKTQILQGS